ncbi:ABC transporter permease [Amycolatopsis magusensis]|uniref:ABC transporter permease n=1 Tax=Amycolatopsis magusensis TaxID=882444 RepID=UPI0024A91FF4|nr:ABC transporter permease [Amycolatopsis magusensis]MDI5979137.1 ABC transporter permease subunit [Amycolatopsis magusensis]
MNAAIHAEWTKFHSVRSTWWSVVTAALLMIGYAGLAGLTVRLGGEQLSAQDAVIGGTFYLGQFAVVTLATLVVTSEYATGAIRSTLQWVPRRGGVLLAKAAVLAPVSFALGALCAAIGVGIAIPLISGAGVPTSFGGALQTTLATGGYFALLSLFCLGVGTALRSTAGSITVVTLLLLMVPILIGGLGLHDVVHFFPGMAGTNAMTSGTSPIVGSPAPYPPWLGLPICAVWSAAALHLGHTLLRRRDA